MPGCHSHQGKPCCGSDPLGIPQHSQEAHPHAPHNTLGHKHANEQEQAHSCCTDHPVTACFIVDLPAGHIHGPGCGHEMVKHGDHWDFLVDGRLHHVVSTARPCMDEAGACCLRRCLAGLTVGQVVDHGLMDVLGSCMGTCPASNVVGAWDHDHDASLPGSKSKSLRRSGSLKNAAAVAYEGAAKLVRSFSAKHAPTHDHILHEQNIVTTRMHVAGICCPMEATLINNILGNMAGVMDVQVHVISQMVTVEHDAKQSSPAALLAALNSAHLDATLHGRSKAKVSHSWLPPWTVLLSGLLLIVSLLSYGDDVHEHLEHTRWVALGSVLLGIPPILIKAWHAMMNFQLDINVLMVVATAGAIGLGDYVEAAAIVVLFGLANWLEDRCLNKARSTLTAVLQLQPDTALLIAQPVVLDAAAGGTTISAKPSTVPMPVEEVPVGSVVLVRPGDKVPLDGRVIKGDSTLDESMLTGETRPVLKSPGAEVFGGTINTGGTSLEVEVTAAAADSTVSRLAQLMEAASQQRSKRDRAVEVFARWYTPLVVLGAALIALVPSLVHKDDWKDWVYIALVVLVTACPCALVISTPVTSVCGLARAAQQGVVVKGSLHLETMGRVSCVTFDKSGTLTQGQFVVVHAESVIPSAPATTTTSPASATSKAIIADSAGCGDQCPHDHTHTPGHSCDSNHGHQDQSNSRHVPEQLSLNYVLGLAATMETHSTHPLAPAIIGYAAAQNAPSRFTATDVKVVVGEGVQGVVDNRQVAVGSARMALSLLSSCPANQPQLSLIEQFKSHWGGQGATACFVMVNGQLVGALAARDMPRGTAKEGVEKLQKRGVTCAMLTGDSRSTAAVVGSQVGLDPQHIHAELLPAQKLDLVKGYCGAAQHHVPAATTTTMEHVAVDMGAAGGDGGVGSTDVKHRGCCGGGSRKRVVAHIGDGINDAPALAVADVGIAMGVGGSALAVEAADIALFTSDLRALAFVRDLGRCVTRVIVINIAVAMAIKVAVLVLAVFGYITLWMSVLADVGSALIVILHGLGVLAFKHKLKPRKATDRTCIGAAALAAAKPAEIECCRKGCCAPAPTSAPAVNSCNKGCCSTSSTLAAPAAIGGCKKGCCSTAASPAPPVPGCEGDSWNVVHNPLAGAALPDIAGCKKGCCATVHLPTPPVSPPVTAATAGTGGCKKGCCSVVTPAATAPLPVLTTGSCAKGCCSVTINPLAAAPAPAAPAPAAPAPAAPAPAAAGDQAIATTAAAAVPAASTTTSTVPNNLRTARRRRSSCASVDMPFDVVTAPAPAATAPACDKGCCAGPKLPDAV